MMAALVTNVSMLPLPVPGAAGTTAAAGGYVQEERQIVLA